MVKKRMAAVGANAPTTPYLKIDVDDDHAIDIWARTFHLTPDELVRLVGIHGPTPNRIRDVLKRLEVASVGGRCLANPATGAGGPRK